ncbi:MAG: c-type cytochrome, partial [Verrucomicrobiales bacterium]|nr:c-type cytochrome [Verrucomicrobiales bacterium]
IEENKLVYDIGWLGAISGGPNVSDGRDHTAVLVSENGTATLYVDGKQAASKPSFTAPDPAGHVFKTARAASDFGGNYNGKIHNTRFYKRALDASEIKAISKSPDSVNTPLLNWSPPSSPGHGHGHIGQPGQQLTLTLSSHFKNPRLQPLGTTPHAALISEWDDASKKRGEKIYNTLCITCHGNMQQPGTLPTALVLHKGEFKNGADPFRMFQTLSRGYGQMVAQNHYSDREKYDVIHYIRESFLKNFNEDFYTTVNPEYLDSLPGSLAAAEEEATSDPRQDLKPYQKMDFGPSLFWTYQVAPDNIAYKALAVRLDPGPGGVSHGKAWMVYDHDTMRVAAAYTGTGNPAGPNFVDWRGIAFDGSHGTHTSIVGDILFTNPVGPGVADPTSGSWDDPRFLGRDEKPYGPLPRSWTHYKGVYHYADKTLIHYTVGGTDVLELPGLIEYGPAPLFTRTLNIAKSNHDLTFRLAPEAGGFNATIAGSKTSKITTADGFHTLTVPASATPAQLTVFLSEADKVTHDALSQVVFTDLRPFTKGSPARWTSDQPVTSEATTSYDEKPWAVDDFTIPDLDANPWDSWMRLGGFDFDPEDPNKATVCTWMGDVWTVEGLAADPPATLTWKRIAAGLFQPLGVKIRDGVTYITCR